MIVCKIAGSTVCRYIAYVREDWDDRLPQELLPYRGWPKPGEEKFIWIGHLELQGQTVLKYTINTRKCKAYIEIGEAELKDGAATVKIITDELLSEVRLAWTHPFELVLSEAKGKLQKPEYSEKGGKKGDQSKGRGKGKRT